MKTDVAFPEPTFRGIPLNWMRAQWRDCASREKQMRIFRELTGAGEREIRVALGDEDGITAPDLFHKKWSAEEDAAILQMRAAGFSYKQISAALRRSLKACEMHARILKRKGKMT